MIKSAVVANIKPEEMRDMTPMDSFLIFEGWQQAHSSNKAGNLAPSYQETMQLVERFG